MAVWSEATVTRVWAGLAWRVRPPTSSFPPVFLGLLLLLYLIFNSFFSSRHNGTACLWSGVIISLSGSCHGAAGGVWLWLCCVVKRGWHIFVWSLLVTPPNWCKKKLKKKKPTKKQKQKHTQKNCILLFQTLLFLIIKLENCVFFILVSSLHSLVSSFYFQGKICFEFFNFFLTRKGRAMGWGGHKGHRPQNEAVTPCPALGPTNQLPFP